MTSLSFTYFFAASSSTIYDGTAANRTVSTTDNPLITVMGEIGNNTGAFEIPQIPSGPDSRVISVDFLNGEPERDAYFSVNDGPEFLAQFPTQIRSFDVVQNGALFLVPGFSTSSNSTMRISNPTAWTPDFYRFGFADAPDFTDHLVSDSSSVLNGGAERRSVNDTIIIVGNVGYNGTVQLTGLPAPAETNIVSVSYANGEDLPRNAYISVNGGEQKFFQFPKTGPSFTVYRPRWLISLSGFNVDNNNTITFSNPSDWAPDLYQVGIASASPSSTTTTATTATATTSGSLTSSTSGSMSTASPSVSFSPTPSSNASTNHTGAIAGGVVGGVVGIALISLLVFLLLRKKRQAPSSAAAEKGDAPYTEPMLAYLPPNNASPPGYAPSQEFSRRLYDPSDPSTYPPSLHESPETSRTRGSLLSPGWVDPNVGPTPEV